MQRFGQVRFGRLLLIGLTLLAACLVYQAVIEEPKYDGKTLTSWLIMAESEQVNGKTNPEEAIRAIGAKALPVFLKMLKTEDPPVVNRVTHVQEHLDQDEEDNPPAARIRQRACFGFQILGPLAKPAIPELTGLLANTNISGHAARALAVISPDAAPSLLLALTNANPIARMWGTIGLGKMEANLPEAIPALVKCLKDPDFRVRVNAAYVLAQFQKQPEIVVQELIPLLKDPLPAVRYQAISALGKFGTNATTAVPALLEFLQDPHGPMRAIATNALNSIRRTEGDN